MTGRFCGHSDPELNERGRQQLAGLVTRMSEHTISQVYGSDLRRSRQTAEAIAGHFGTALRVRHGLREIHFGLWEGLRWSEIEARDPVAAKRWIDGYPNLTAPGGESFEQFESRVLTELAFLTREATQSSIAVVTHAGFIRVALMNRFRISAQEAWDLTKDYGSVVQIDANYIVTSEIGDSDFERLGIGI
jgi:alpha-ribazole phosphatase